MSKRVVPVFALLVILGCKSATTPADPAQVGRFRGGQWLTWSQSQRDSFISAYVDGYGMGISRACSGTDRSLELPKDIPPHDKDEIVVPSTLCRAGVSEYSKCKPGSPEGQVCAAYTDVITAFYSDHPEYRQIPFEYLMQYLTDDQHKSTEDLYKMARYGEMRTHWSSE